MRKSYFWGLEAMKGRGVGGTHYVLEASEGILELILPNRNSRRLYGVVLFVETSVFSTVFLAAYLQLGIPSNLTTVAAYLTILVLISIVALRVDGWSLRYLARHPEESWRILVQEAQLGTYFHRLRMKPFGDALWLRVQGLRGRISAALTGAGFSI